MAAIGFFKSPTTGNAVTWDETGAQTDTGISHGAYTLPTAQSGPTFGGGPAPVHNQGYIGSGAVSSDGNLANAIRQSDSAVGSAALQALSTKPVTEYFISPSTGNMVTWDATGKQTDTGQKPGLAQNLAAGYDASMPVDPLNPNAGPNRGTGSVWNHISDMPTDTYQQYLTKMGSMKTNEMGAWLQGGSAPLSEADWNAQRQRAAADASRGITFGGGAEPPRATPPAVQGPLQTTAPTQTNPQVSPLPAQGGALTTLYQPGQTTGGAAVAPAQPMNWGAPPAQSFNTPMLDALYNAQQQRMTTPAPTFNFQAKPGEPQGALTQAITGT